MTVTSTTLSTNFNARTAEATAVRRRSFASMLWNTIVLTSAAVTTGREAALVYKVNVARGASAEVTVAAVKAVYDRS